MFLGIFAMNGKRIDLSTGGDGRLIWTTPYAK
jgi:hypothetical protein